MSMEDIPGGLLDRSVLETNQEKIDVNSSIENSDWIFNIVKEGVVLRRKITENEEI